MCHRRYFPDNGTDEILIWTKCWRQLSFQHSIIQIIAYYFVPPWVQNVWPAATVQCAYSGVWSEGGKNNTEQNSCHGKGHLVCPLCYGTYAVSIPWIAEPSNHHGKWLFLPTGCGRRAPYWFSAALQEYV